VFRTLKGGKVFSHLHIIVHGVDKHKKKMCFQMKWEKKERGRFPGEIQRNKNIGC
jgi:hypothetical protein